MLKRTDVRRQGRPRIIKGGGQAVTLYLNQTRIDDFRKLCNDYGISVSEGLRQLMDQELEKNEAGLINPINIVYGLHNKANHEKCWRNLTLETYMISKDEARNDVEQLPKEQLTIAYSNHKKYLQQLDFRMRGKTTLI